MSFFRWEGEDLILKVRVQPKASRDALMGPQGDALKVSITAPPQEGKANAHLIRFLAKCFQVAPSRITLLSGARGKVKRLRIASPGRIPEELRGFLQHVC
ncbi:MAG: YggU family protein [Gammaproteobacteria bacterium]|nr:MAG: YggU family protein [Gammaproteobacteria bacterium]